MEITFSTTLQPAFAGFQVSAEVGGTWEIIPAILTFDGILTESADASTPDIAGTLIENMVDISMPEEDSDKVSLLKIVVDTMDLTNRSSKHLFCHFRNISFTGSTNTHAPSAASDLKRPILLSPMLNESIQIGRHKLKVRRSCFFSPKV